MFQDKLKEIDQQLIELLGKRIAILTESESISLKEQFVNFESSLVQAGVPESIWKNLIICCAAAVATRPLSPTNLNPRRVTLVGGSGMMGQFFTQWLSAAGHHVTILEQDDWQQAKSLLQGADLVLVCVPIEHTIEVVYNLAQYLDVTTALVDIASIKTPVLQAMLESHNGPVMGLHPMFGKGVTSFLSQKVVVCPGREYQAFQWLLDMIENDGGKLILCTPEEHDHIMLTVQAIRNFQTFSLGIFMAKEKIDICRSLDFSSPIFRLEIDIVSRLFTQSAPLVVDIMLATPERREAINRLANTYNRLAQLIVQNDRDALIKEFKESYHFLAEKIDLAVEETNYVINALSTLLAAKEIEQEHQIFTLSHSRNSN